MAWGPPAGSEPRESGENEAVFAAAQASPVPQDSVQGEGSTPEPKHSRPASAEQAAELDPARLGAPEAALEDSMADTKDGELPAHSSLPMQPVQIPMPDEAIGQVQLASSHTQCSSQPFRLIASLCTCSWAKAWCQLHGQTVPLRARNRRCILCR